MTPAYGVARHSCHCHPFSALPAAQDRYPVVPLVPLSEEQTGQQILPGSSGQQDEPASTTATRGWSLLGDDGF